MANLRNIKDRITSIQNTQKITRAMKMIAAAKVKKAENAVKMSRPFTFELYKMFSKVFESLGGETLENIKVKQEIENYPKLLEKREIKTVGFVVMSSNKGLAGAYSANIVRYTINEIKKALDEGKKVKLYLAGQKAYPALNNAKRNLDFEIKEVYTSIMDDPDSTNSLILAQDLAKEFVNKEIDSIELITTRYVNMMTYRVEKWTLLPVVREEEIKAFHKKEFDEEHKVEHIESKHKICPLSDFMPDLYSVLQKIVPMYITNIIFQAFLEAQASELASRMTAMSAATNNAQEMIRVLTIDYNKARQAQITQELNEVVSGADALK